MYVTSIIQIGRADNSLELTLQIGSFTMPELFTAPVRKILLEFKVISLCAAPCQKVDLAHCAVIRSAQRCESIRAFQSILRAANPIPTAFVGVTGQQQPEVLNRRTVHHIVKINDH